MAEILAHFADVFSLVANKIKGIAEIPVLSLLDNFLNELMQFIFFDGD